MIEVGQKTQNFPQSEKKINNAGYKFLVILSMLYMSLMLFNAILTNRYIGTDWLFVLGGTLTSPFIFILDDIIAEIYGYKITRSVIFSGFIMQLLFCFLSIAIIDFTPHPSFFTENDLYSNMFGNSLLHITISGFIAYAIANLVNAYIITRWKVLLKGKKFWLRSIGSSIFSEILYSSIAIVMMEIGRISLEEVIKVIIISCSIKILYSIIFAFPANVLTNYIKTSTGIDVYDLPKKFTPLRYFKAKTVEQYD